jgi:ElaB/YqjD/DUF883 family membrane-anchored ribosome-binding protein
MAVGDGGQQRANQQGSAQRAGGQDSGGPQDWGAIKDDVGEIAGTAVEKGRQLLDSTLDSAREQATGYVDQRKDEVAQAISDFARSLRDACKEFDDRPNIRGLVDSAADGIDDFAESIRARSFNEIFDHAETMIRRRPGTVAVASAAIGFLVARFIKASGGNIRAEEARRRRTASKRPRGQGHQRQTRAQASPGSSYARSGV